MTPKQEAALRLANSLEAYPDALAKAAAAELRRMHDLLGKANALCRIRAEEIERLKAQPEQEPVAWVERDGELVWNNREAAIGRNLYIFSQPSKPEDK